MDDKGAHTNAARFAESVFAELAKGPLSKERLTVALAVFGQAMWRHGYACGKGHHPPAPVDAHGKLVDLSAPKASRGKVKAAEAAGPCSPEALALLPKKLPRTKEIGGVTAHLGRHPTSGEPIYMTVPGRDE
jgi:hypothetical protein